MPGHLVPTYFDSGEARAAEDAGFRARLEESGRELGVNAEVPAMRCVRSLVGEEVETEGKS